MSRMSVSAEGHPAKASTANDCATGSGMERSRLLDTYGGNEAFSRDLPRGQVFLSARLFPKPMERLGQPCLHDADIFNLPHLPQRRLRVLLDSVVVRFQCGHGSQFTACFAIPSIGSTEIFRRLNIDSV